MRADELEMSKIEPFCLFDDSKKCPTREAMRGLLRIDIALPLILDKACPICPTHAEMMKGKGAVR